MRRSRVIIIIILFLFSGLEEYVNLGNPIIRKSNFKLVTTSDSNENVVFTEKDSYSVLEENITANFQYSIPYETPHDVVSFRFSSDPDSISLENVIYKTDWLVENGTPGFHSGNLTFYFSEYNLSIPQEGKFFYISVVCYNTDIYKQTILAEKRVKIEREPLYVTIPQNNTEISYLDTIYIFLSLSCKTEPDYNFENETIYYHVLNNQNEIHTGRFNISKNIGFLVFDKDLYETAGKFIIKFKLYNSTIFNNSEYFCNILINPYTLKMRFEGDSSYNGFLQVQTKYLNFPIYVSLLEPNGSIYINNELKIKAYYNKYYIYFKNLDNGSYYLDLIANNTKQYSKLIISLESNNYYAKSLEYYINISKRPIIIKRIFMDIVNLTNINSYQLYFELKDKLNQEPIYNKTNEVLLQYFMDKSWHNIKLPIYNSENFYGINISSNNLKIREIFLKQNLIMFRILFFSDNLYSSTNSSVFYIYFKPHVESMRSEQIFISMTIGSLGLGIILSPILLFNLYKTKLKKVYKLKDIGI